MPCDSWIARTRLLTFLVNCDVPRCTPLCDTCSPTNRLPSALTHSTHTLRRYLESHTRFLLSSSISPLYKPVCEAFLLHCSPLTPEFTYPHPFISSLRPLCNILCALISF
ncbi:unnamed protein product [Dicrocoelium dendriticum]|nr:unnamed protein product [Dicrocoelium dendriticum]